MTRVWLVGTVHEEKGLACVSALQAILERIRPEVIFLEVPPVGLDAFLNAPPSNLESTAVRRYREGHNAALVPVDLPTPVEAFFRNNRYLFERIEKASYDYGRLVDLNSQYVAAHGFSYLNSERCSQRWTDVYVAMRVAVEQLADRRLTELHDLWTTTNELRDQAMLQGIEDYSKLQPFETGVLLVGVAHRQSILDKSRKERAAVSLSIEGDIAEFLDPSHR